MTEAQKYQGAHYKEKPTKNQRKEPNHPKQNSKSDANNKPVVKSLQPSVEDASDDSSPRHDGPPPPAPTPPVDTTVPPFTTEAHSGQPVNVFDYLVPEDTPKKPVNHAPSLSHTGRDQSRANTKSSVKGKDHDVTYEENGFSYGTSPVKPSANQGIPSYPSMEYMTPMPKKKKDRSRNEVEDSRDNRKAGNTSDRKRKRGNMEDVAMTDAPPSTVKSSETPVLNHSGLTGGIERMLHSLGEEHEHSDKHHPDNTSPIKRTRRGDKDPNSDSRRSRTERFVSSMFGFPGENSEITSKGIVRTHRDSSHPTEAQKTKKTHRHSSQSSAQPLSSSLMDPRKPTQKSGDADHPPSYSKQLKPRRDHHNRPRPQSPGGDSGYSRPATGSQLSNDNGQELQHQMASRFLSLVTKGPESGRGMSVHKALKRLHNDRSDQDLDREQQFEDDREMWRALRLKRNERGEVVLFL